MLNIVFRIALAFILGGAIGYERERKNMPAGFRTHILVCVGATLVMLTSVFVEGKYPDHGLDPTRLGAQVISGIGFLGAGTILRQGVNIKGLTTAASLWATACLGLAIGIGFYEGAIIAGIAIYLTLVILNFIEKNIKKRSSSLTIEVELSTKIFDIGKMDDFLDSNQFLLKGIDLKELSNGNYLMKMMVKKRGEISEVKFVNEISKMENVISVKYRHTI